ncbi:MAG TPA: hypothetical protein VL334_04540 [Anaerolineae bacterium]|nr:hypothetical protein [Anaerolineae bacterium]
MATIPPYVSEGAAAGQAAEMKIHKLMWLTVGNGKLFELTDYVVDIDGQIDIVVYKGNLHIRIELLDQDAAADAGPCRLQLNAHVDENASYQVKDDFLTVSATIKEKSATVSLSRDNNGEKTKCVLTGFLDITCWLEAKED